MAHIPVLVFADGVAAEPRSLLLSRAKLEPARALLERASPVCADEATLDCPISRSGTLNVDEAYQDGTTAGRSYRLPVYATAVAPQGDPPQPRYDVKLQLTPEGPQVGRLRVCLHGVLPDPSAASETPAATASSTEIRFASLPDGRVISAATFLRGDEFAGVTLAAVPQSTTYCGQAREVVIRPAGTYGSRVPLLCAAQAGNPAMCNTVPIEITFAAAVARVSLSFVGAAVTYSLRAFDAQGTLLGQADQTVATFAPATEHEVTYESGDNRICRVLFGHFGSSAPPLVALTGIRCARTATQEVQPLPLPHRVALSLRYQAMESGAGGSRAVGTWKSLAFDSVLHREHREIEATVGLRTLPELDAVHRALSDPQAMAQLIVHCGAEVAVKNSRQIYVPKRSGTLAESVRPALKLHRPPTRSLPRVPVLPPAPPPAPVLAPAEVRMPMIERSPTSALLSAIRPRVSLRAASGENHADLVRDASLPEHAVRADSLARCWKGEHTPPGRYFGDARGEPAYTRLQVSLDQQIPFHFDPALHGYIYPPRPPASGPALIRYAVTPDLVIFQDAVERQVFYFLPDEFRLARDEVRAPTYRPALQVAFFSLRSTAGGEASPTVAEGSGSASDGAPTGDDEGDDYGVQFTFRAVPYLHPDRVAQARRYIRDNALVPDARPAALLPLCPDWCLLTLTLPDDAGGTRSEERPQATLVFDKYVVDSLTMSSSAFAEIFQSMRVGGETLNGAVKYRLPGVAPGQEQAVPFSGRLDKLVGPVLDAELMPTAGIPDGSYRIAVRNGIESRVTLTQAAIYLLQDPEAGNWVLAPLQAGALPLTLGATESRSLSVETHPGLEQAFAARILPTQLQIDIDFEALWASVLETPGWDDITQSVAVSVDGAYFTGGNALSSIQVSFNHDEANLELTAARPSGEVKLIRPFLPYLLRLASADRYLFRVESYAVPSSGGAPVRIAESAWTAHDGPALTILPPRP
jgi:hypothetical protein